MGYLYLTMLITQQRVRFNWITSLMFDAHESMLGVQFATYDQMSWFTLANIGRIEVLPE